MCLLRFFTHKNDVWFVFTSLFIGELMSNLRYLCLFAHSGVQHILYCSFFLLFFFVLCTLWSMFLWIVHFWLSLQYSLAFIYCSWVGEAVLIVRTGLVSVFVPLGPLWTLCCGYTGGLEQPQTNGRIFFLSIILKSPPKKICSEITVYPTSLHQLVYFICP